MFLNTTAREMQVGIGLKAKVIYNLYLSKEITYRPHLPNSGIGKLSFEWDCLCAAREDCLSELADYRKIHGHRNVPKHYKEMQVAIGSQSKGPITICTEKERISMTAS
jgi:hypothetical protein